VKYLVKESEVYNILWRDVFILICVKLVACSSGYEHCTKFLCKIPEKQFYCENTAYFIRPAPQDLCFKCLEDDFYEFKNLKMLNINNRYKHENSLCNRSAGFSSQALLLIK
jgi:hypothetical protein